MLPSTYRFLADIILVLHFAVVVFIVGGLVAIVAGNVLRWRWVNRLWFRAAHLAAILFVVAQAWLGQTCPLTTVEAWLRARANAAPHGGSFIEYWLQRWLFYEAEPWVFTTAYTAFALAVLLVWWRFPAHRRHKADE